MASTPSPLPEPQPINLAPMDLLLLAGANATNGTQPHIVAGVVPQTQTVSDAATNSQAASQLSNVQDLVAQLQKESPADQHAQYSTATKSVQNQLLSAGYTPVSAPSRSIWGDITHTISDVAKPVGDVLSSHPVSDVLNLANAPLRGVEHGFRAFVADQGNAQTGGSGFFGNAQQNPFYIHSFSKLISPSDWSRAWNETSSGSSDILPAIKRQVQDKYGPDTYNIALQIAQGKTINQIIAAAPQAQQAQLAQSIQNNKDLSKATQALNAAHVSIGRMMVGATFMANHPDAGMALSGGIDATFDWYADPINVVGGLVGDASKVKYLVSKPADVQTLYDKMPSVQRGMEALAEKVRTGTLATMDALPEQKIMARQLVAAEADTQRKVLEYFKTKAWQMDTIAGSPSNTAAFAESGMVLPHLSLIGQARQSVKATMINAIDFAADHPINMKSIPVEDMQTTTGDLHTAVLNKQLKITPKLLAPEGLKEKSLTTVGRFVRQATTLIPQHGFFNPYAADAPNVLRDIGLSLSLPKWAVDEAVTNFVKATDQGQMWKVYRSLMIQGADAIGMDRDSDLWKTWYSKFESRGDGVVYAPKRLDVKMVDDEPTHVGVLKQDMSSGWSIPNYRELRRKANQASITNAFIKGINAEWMDKFMNMWRPVTLAHPGFAMRVGGEELFGFGLREGFGNYLRASAARTLAKTALKAAGKAAPDTLEDLSDAKAAGVWERFTSHLPTGVKQSIQTPNDLWREYMVDYTKRAFAKTAQTISTPHMQTSVDEYIKREGNLLPDDLTAMHGYDHLSGNEDGIRTMNMRKNGKMVKAYLDGSGAYKLYNPSDSLYVQMWHRMLHAIATDDWGREALPTFTVEDGSYNRLSRSDRIQKVADKLQSDPYWTRHYGSVADRSGNLVALGQITARKAAEDHAAVIIDTVDQTVRKGSEEIPVGDTTLTGYLLRNGKPPSLVALGKAPPDLLPDSVRGEELAPTSWEPGNIARATNWLFTHQIGPQINWLSRQPMFFFHYDKGRQLFESQIPMWQRAGLDDENISQLLHENARDYAVNQSVKYVHNPSLRSEMSAVTRNLAPFWFAQEQFYKRWSRTLTYAPNAFRKAQLISQGVRHSGLTQKDPQSGQEYFVYPGSGLVQDVLTSFLARVGIQGEIPVNAGLAGQVNMLSPGLQRVGLPSWGPLVTFPTNVLQSLDPHMHRAISDVEGPQAANAGLLKSLFPSTITHVLNVAIPSLDAAQWYSAQMQAIQYMEASGHGMSIPATTPVSGPDIADPKPGDYYMSSANAPYAYVYQPDGKWTQDSARTLQDTLERVKNWSRILFATRAIFGFAAPASPEDQFDPSNLDGQLSQLMSTMPFDNAIQVFLEQHPNATPYTVFQTQNETGGSLPATSAAMSFIDSNPKLVTDHSLAAPYFIPPADTSAPFSLNAYHEQLQNSLRLRKDPQTFYNQVVYEQAANIYFKVEDAKNQMVAAKTANPTTINDQFAQWSEQYLQANPIFAALYGEGGFSTTPGVVAAGATGRMQIMDDVGAALSDGTAPQNAQSGALSVLFQTWQAWQSMTGTYGNPNQPSMSSTEKLDLDEQFAEWLADYTAQNPGVVPLVNRAIAPDLTTAINTLAVQGTAISLTGSAPVAAEATAA